MTRPATPDLIDDLRRRGYEIVAVADGELRDEVLREAVALLSGPDSDGDPVQLAKRSGIGLIAGEEGISTLVRRAAQAGVAAHSVDRAVLAYNPDPARIERALDRAAFEARRDGTALFLGRANAATVEALERWRQGLGAQDIALAPASAVLARSVNR